MTTPRLSITELTAQQNGAEALSWLAKVFARAPGVVQDGEIVQAASLAGTVGFLAKPWTPQELLAVGERTGIDGEAWLELAAE